jgi:hypothetical protein
MRASVRNTQPFTEKAVMFLCKSCASENQTECGTEIMIHLSGLKNLDKLPILVFPKLLICLDCGFTEFTISETQLRLLGERGVASAAA